MTRAEALVLVAAAAAAATEAEEEGEAAEGEVAPFLMGPALFEKTDFGNRHEADRKEEKKNLIV